MKLSKRNGRENYPKDTNEGDTIKKGLNELTLFATSQNTILRTVIIMKGKKMLKPC